jgi:hypothetical protein
MFVGAVGPTERKTRSNRPPVERVNGYSPGKGQKKDSDEDVEKRKWESGLDTPVGFRHPHSHISHPFHDARLYMT